MYPHRAWDPGLDPQAGRGYGQQQPGQQAQGQSASGTWQDQVRGNPAAEYAALMQSRAAEGTDGGVPGHAQFTGMPQMGMSQAIGEQGFGAGGMQGGYAPRGDPAAAYAAMMQAQTAPTQLPATQMQLGAPAAGIGWQGAMMEQMNRGMWPSDGSAATGGTTAIAAPPRPYVQPATQPMAQQLMFTPMAGAAVTTDVAESVNTTAGAVVGETRGREASPPRLSTPSARMAVRTWGSKWLRELTVEEGTTHAELDGDEIRTLMKIAEDEVYPPAAFMDEAVKYCRASSGLRGAAIVKWTHKAFSTLVMTRALTELLWPARQSVEMQQLEVMRDAIMEVFPWAFNVVFEDDYDWPERGQTQTAATKRDAVVRVVWIELVLRLGIAAKRGLERNVQHLLPMPPEDGAEAATGRVTIAEPAEENARRDLGADVARAYGKGRAMTTALNTEADTAEFRRRKHYKSLAVRWMRRMRNDAVADENHTAPELVHLRAHAISEVRRRNVMVVDDRDAKAVTEEIVALGSRSKLSALHGTLRSPAELVMCEAGVGEEIVRQMVDAVELVAKQPHVDAVKDFAVKIVTAISEDEAGAAGTPHETFHTVVATLSPLVKDFTKPDNQFGAKMAKQLAWIRSKDAKSMMSLLNERMTECAARGVPGTVTRDDDMASPARARGRTDADAAAAHAVVDGVAATVPMLPMVNEDAGTATVAPSRTWRGRCGGAGAGSRCG